MIRLAVTRDNLPADDSLIKVRSTPIILQIRNPFDVIVSAQLVFASNDQAAQDIDQVVHHVRIWISLNLQQMKKRY